MTVEHTIMIVLCLKMLAKTTSPYSKAACTMKITVMCTCLITVRIAMISACINNRVIAIGTQAMDCDHVFTKYVPIKPQVVNCGSELTHNDKTNFAACDTHVNLVFIG